MGVVHKWCYFFDPFLSYYETHFWRKKNFLFSILYKLTSLSSSSSSNDQTIFLFMKLMSRFIESEWSGRRVLIERWSIIGNYKNVREIRHLESTSTTLWIINIIESVLQLAIFKATWPSSSLMFSLPDSVISKIVLWRHQAYFKWVT